MMINTKKNKILLVAAVTLISFVYYYFNCVNELKWVNSDAAFYANAGWDFSSGNLLLKGWYASTNSYFLCCIIYGIAGKIFGFSAGLFYVVSALVWAVLVAVVSMILLTANVSDDSEKIPVFKLMIFMAVLYTSCYFSQGLKIFGGSHIDVALTALVFDYLVCRFVEEKRVNIIAAILMSVIFFVATGSDLTFVIFGVLPLAGVLLLWCIFSKKKVRALVALIYVLGLYGLSHYIWEFLKEKELIMITPFDAAKTGFITMEQLPEKLNFYAKEFLYMLGGEKLFEGVSFLSVWFVLKLIIFALLLMLVLLNLKKIFSCVFNQVMAAAFAGISVVVIFTDYLSLTDGLEYTSRVVFMLFFAFTIIISQADLSAVKINLKKSDGVICSANKYLEKAGIVICGILVLSSLLTFKVETSENLKNSTPVKVASVLNEKGLTEGYGIYELSNNVTVFSGEKAQVYPLYNDEEMQRYKWLSKNNKSREYANFVVVDEAGWAAVTVDTLKESFGEPEEIVNIDDAYILIWSDNIRPLIK